MFRLLLLAWSLAGASESYVAFYCVMQCQEHGFVVFSKSHASGHAGVCLKDVYAISPDFFYGA